MLGHLPLDPRPSAGAALSSRPRPVAMTLVELLVAVAVLTVVLMVAGRLFAVGVRVAGMGAATADVLRETAVTERRLRDDFSHLSPDAVFAIRCVEVPNDLHGDRRLDPARPADAIIRADQLLYFTNRIERARILRPGQGVHGKPAATSARVYFGHALQIGPAGPPVEVEGGEVFAWDPIERWHPWSAGALRLARTRYSAPAAGTNMFERTATRTVHPPLVSARRWLLVRQPILLVDDDTGPLTGNGKTVFLDQVLAARSIFRDDPRLGPGRGPGRASPVHAGRVDAAASRLDDVRRVLMGFDSDPRPWRRDGTLDQFTLIADHLLGYPRAERRAPGPYRTDQALTTSVIGSACSSVIIDWSYDAADDREASAPFPWFGLTDADRGVQPFGANDIERVRTVDRVQVYDAVFGLDHGPATGWPDRVRVTLVLHDPGGRLEHGRRVQFIFDLPRRTRRP